jgi:hypothetical protein
MSPDLAPIIASLETERQALESKICATWPLIGIAVGLAYGSMMLLANGVTLVLANVILAAPAVYFHAQHPLDKPTWNGLLFLGLFSNALFIPCWLWQQELGGFLSVLVLGFMGLIVFVFYIGFLTRFFSHAYRNRFKVNLVSRIIQQRLPNARYAPQGGLGREAYQQSHLFRKGLGNSYQYDEEDFVEAEVEGLQLKFCEVRIHQNHEKITISGAPRTPTPQQKLLKPSNFTEGELFQGLFLQAKFSKRTPGETLVLEAPAFLENTKGLRPVKLESTEFEQLYDCFGSDQVESRYVLSTSFMERVLEYCQRTRVLPIFSFIQGQLSIAIPNDQNFFEPNLFKAFQPNDLSGYLAQLEFVLEILTDLKLNRQIWQ